MVLLYLIVCKIQLQSDCLHEKIIEEEEEEEEVEEEEFVG